RLGRCAPENRWLEFAARRDGPLHAGTDSRPGDCRARPAGGDLLGTALTGELLAARGDPADNPLRVGIARRASCTQIKDLPQGLVPMGHNRGGDRARVKRKRRQRDEKRMRAKGTAVPTTAAKAASGVTR